MTVNMNYNSSVADKYFMILTFDLTDLENVHVMNACGKFCWNLSTK